MNAGLVKQNNLPDTETVPTIDGRTAPTTSAPTAPGAQPGTGLSDDTEIGRSSKTNLTGRSVGNTRENDDGRGLNQRRISVNSSSVTFGSSRTNGRGGLSSGDLTIGRDSIGGNVSFEKEGKGGVSAGGNIVHRVENRIDKGNAATDLLGRDVVTHSRTLGLDGSVGGKAKGAGLTLSGNTFGTTELHTKLTRAKKKELFGDKDPATMSAVERDLIINAHLADRTRKLQSIDDLELGDGSGASSTKNEQSRSSLDVDEAVTFTSGSGSGVEFGGDAKHVGGKVKVEGSRAEQTTIARNADDNYRVRVSNVDEEGVSGELSTAGGNLALTGENKKTDLQQITFDAKGKDGVAALEEYKRTGLLPNIRNAAEEGDLAAFDAAQQAVDNARTPEEKALARDAMKTQARIANARIMSRDGFDIRKLSSGDDASGVKYDSFANGKTQQDSVGGKILGLGGLFQQTTEHEQNTQYVDPDGTLMTEASNVHEDWGIWSGTERNTVVAEPQKNPDIAVAVDTERLSTSRDRKQVGDAMGDKRGQGGQMDEFVDGNGPSKGTRMSVALSNEQVDRIAETENYDEVFEDVAPGYATSVRDAKEAAEENHRKKKEERNNPRLDNIAPLLPPGPLSSAKVDLIQVRDSVAEQLKKDPRYRDTTPEQLASSVKTKEDFQKLPKAMQAYMVKDKAASLAAQGKNAWDKTLEMAALIDDDEVRADAMRSIGKAAVDFNTNPNDRRNSAGDLIEHLQKKENDPGTPYKKGELLSNARIELKSEGQDSANAKVDEILDADETQGDSAAKDREMGDMLEKQILDGTDANTSYLPEFSWKNLKENLGFDTESGHTEATRAPVRSLTRIEERQGRTAAVRQLAEMKARLGPKWEAYKAELHKNWPAGAKTIEDLDQDATPKTGAPMDNPIRRTEGQPQLA